MVHVLYPGLRLIGAILFPEMTLVAMRLRGKKAKIFKDRILYMQFKHIALKWSTLESKRLVK
jgi:hypothetical protein